jgi:2Fe-2S ferredoxin
MHVIVVNGPDGSRQEVDVPKGQPLLSVLRKLKVGIVGLCNGNAACGTCHVYVDPAWLNALEEPDEYEAEMIEELNHRRDNSRLSCQIEYESELDGLEMTVAPHN